MVLESAWQPTCRRFGVVGRQSHPPHALLEAQMLCFMGIPAYYPAHTLMRTSVQYASEDERKRVCGADVHRYSLGCLVLSVLKQFISSFIEFSIRLVEFNHNALYLERNANTKQSPTPPVLFSFYASELFRTPP